jgi:signal transduction histidine kinase
MSSSDYFATDDIVEFRKRIDEITDQLCAAVSGDFDFMVRATVADETLDKLAMLINFLIEAARRSLVTLKTQNTTLSELDQMKSDFLANLSHELRTPLTLILAPLRSILNGQYGALPESAVPVVERVLRNTVRLNGMVNDLLDVSKLEAGKMTIHLGKVNPAELVSTLVKELEPAAHERKIQVQADVDRWPRGTCALLDASMFEKIALNLLSNAFKFTPEGGSVVATVSMTDGALVLSVSDTGIGISQENKALLFQRFQQIDSESNRYHHGTGLGLALVKEFSELLKGTVSVESEAGVGSKFTVRIPYIEVGSSTAATTATAASAATETPRVAPAPPQERSSLSELVRSESLPRPEPTASPFAQLLQPTVLIVEDNPDLQQYVQETLGADFRVLTASNGEEALSILRAHEPDVILSDVMMPGMDGLELLRRIKSHPVWKFIPVILLTAKVAREERLAGLDEGADDYLTKPFDAVELKTRLRAALRVRALYRELESKNDELQSARSGLQRKVEERTYELSLQSQKAMAANKAKDQFLANMSHEMRTPLTAIIGFSDLVAAGANENEAVEFQETIRRNAQHLLSLIDEILDFSKIESGTMTIERSTIETRDFFTGIESTFKPAVEKKGIDLRLELDAGVPPALKTDAKRLRQMVVNLIGNAVKFTERGSVKIEVHVIDDRGSPQLRIRVIDTGIGIPNDVHNRLFAPFSQADMSLSRKFGGTGLGLALSRKMARSLGGELMIESSQPGVGSVFTLWVPVEISSEPAFEKPSRSKTARSPRRSSLKSQKLAGMHILLAEDSVDNRRLLERLLKGAGAQIVTVADGIEAVEKARTQSFDVILMDIQMPRLDGFSATRQIRAAGFTKPILALTAHASEQDLERVLEAGCNDRLVKPIEFDQMVSSLLASTALQRS